MAESINRYMYCPQCRTLLRSSKGIINPFKMRKTYDLLFKCDACDCLFINGDAKKNTTYKGKTIYATKNEVFNRNPGVNIGHKYAKQCTVEELLLPIRTYRVLIEENLTETKKLYGLIAAGIENLYKIQGLNNFDVEEILMAIKSKNPEFYENIMTNNPVHYMECPVHTGHMMKSTVIAKDGLMRSGKYEYYFICSRCKRMYYHSDNCVLPTQFTKIIDRKRQLPIYATKNKSFTNDDEI